MDKINGYELSRTWFNWCFENPEKISPNHTALYFFIIEHCNRLGWKKKFGLPTTMAMEAIGIKSYNTYIKTFRELIDFEVIILHQKSTNQYSANVIELSNADKALDKALDKAMIKHSTKQVGSTGESISSVDKQVTSNKEQVTNGFSSKKPIVRISSNDVDEVYKSYPTRCPIRDRSLGKGVKDKDKIKALLKKHSKDELIKIINLSIQDCISSNTFVANFSTFLNNLPDIEALKENTIQSQTKTNY